MFSLFKKMFAKQPAGAPQAKATPVVVRAPRAVAATPATMTAQPQPQVQVAQLSLAAILQKFPEDLRHNIAKIPDATVTVALPLATIHKQLSQGAVKMSLASLYRQSPPGTFRETKSEEKRMVEVPLTEVMRHVDVQGLRRRTDQKRVELPKGAPALFGDRANPYVMAPSFSDDEEMEEVPTAAAAKAQASPAARTALKMSEDEGEEEPFRMTPTPRTATPSPGSNGSGMKFPAVAPAASTPRPSATPVSGTLNLRLGDLCEAWPEPIRSEALGMAERIVALPAEVIAAGVGRGKVAFSWGQVRSFITPTPAGETEGREATELSLPLKVVAPAFLAHSRPTTRRRAVELDDSIPDMFNGAGTAAAPTPEPQTMAVEEVAPAPLPAAPKALKFVLNDEAPAAAEPEPEAAPAPVEAVAPAPAHDHHASSEGNQIGQLFGQPEKTSWSVQEIIEQTAKLPGVAGAVLALQEGLLVAAKMPAEMKGETMAAFIPQIFARLNVYAGEMKLAAVEEILMTTNGAHFQAYRLGQIYFAVLGQQGGALPWDALRIVVDELVKQSPA